MFDTEFVLTREGFDEMQRELNEILTVKRPLIIDRIRDARHLGDLSENSDYEDAKHAQALLDARVKELKAILAHANVVEGSNDNSSVGIGSKVTVEDTEDKVKDEFVIVGTAESSPAEGRISHESLVGSALMGRKKGDVVEVEAPGGIIRYKIVSIR